MKRVLILVVLLCFALVGTSMAAFITPEQAMEAVRAFEDNSKLKFDSVELNYGSGPAEPPERNVYELYISDESDRTDDWEVDAVTGEVIDARHFNAYPDVDSSDTPFGPLAQEQCKRIAEDCVRRNCSLFSTRNFQMNGSGEWDECTWVFGWAEYLPNRARTHNYIQVTINPVDGRVIWYTAEVTHTHGDWTKMITPEQALDAVRAFEVNPNLQLSEPLIERDDLDPTWLQQDKYTVKLDIPDVTQEWEVDALTGEVISAYYGDAHPEADYSDEPFGSFPQEQCQQIADEFGRRHYSGFGSLNLRSGECWDLNGWDFVWREVIPCGAGTPNHVSVSINPEDGRIMSYSSLRIPTPTPPDPQIDAQQAVSIIARKLDIENLQWEDNEASLFATPERITWSGAVGVEGDNGFGVVCLAEVDAITGEIIELNYPCSAPGNAAGIDVNSVKSDSDNLVPIRDAIKTIPNASVRWIPGTGAKLTVGKSTCIIKPGTVTVEWNEKNITLSNKPVIKNDRLMIPQDFIDQLMKDLE